LREEIASLNEQLAKAKEATADLDLLDSLERSKAQGDKKLQVKISSLFRFLFL